MSGRNFQIGKMYEEQLVIVSLSHLHVCYVGLLYLVS